MNLHKLRFPPHQFRNPNHNPRQDLQDFHIQPHKNYHFLPTQDLRGMAIFYFLINIFQERCKFLLFYSRWRKSFCAACKKRGSRMYYIKSKADYNQQYQASISDPQKFWAEIANNFFWFENFTQTSNCNLAQGQIEND